MSFNYISNLQLISDLFPVYIEKINFGTVLTFDIISAGVLLWPILDQLLHFFKIILIDSLRVGKILGNVYWYHDLIDGAIGVRRNDSSASEVNSLS
jgi:hypothetical protein